MCRLGSDLLDNKTKKQMDCSCFLGSLMRSDPPRGCICRAVSLICVETKVERTLWFRTVMMHLSQHLKCLRIHGPNDEMKVRLEEEP